MRRPAPLVIACAGLAATLTAIRRDRRRWRGSRAYQLVVIGHPQDAEEFIEAYRHDLRDSSLTDDARSALDLLLASALARPVDARRPLRRRTGGTADRREMDRDRHARGMVGAAMSLVPALVVRAQATGDADELEDGLAVVAQTIARVPSLSPVAQRLLLVWRSRGLLERRAHAENAGDTDECCPYSPPPSTTSSARWS